MLVESPSPTPPFATGTAPNELSVGAERDACTEDTDLWVGTHDWEMEEGSFGLEYNSDEGVANNEKKPEENEEDRLCLFVGRILRWVGSRDAVISILPPPIIERFTKLDLSAFNARSWSGVVVPFIGVMDKLPTN
jgi:hypothetical protein